MSNRQGEETDTLKFFTLCLSVFYLLLAAAVCCAAGQQKPAPAGGFYVSVAPSAVFPFFVETTSPGLSPAETKAEWGWEIGAGLGYRRRDFRIEGEVTYGRHEASDIRFAGGGGDLSGHYNLWGAVVNVFYDIPTGVRLRPYVGVGAGVVRFEARDIRLANFPPTEGLCNLFTYRLMAGLSWMLSDAWRLTAGYRFAGMNGPEFETGGALLSGEPFSTHAFSAGIQYHF
jgi:opacity protein-like surface antigen